MLEHRPFAAKETRDAPFAAWASYFDGNVRAVRRFRSIELGIFENLNDLADCRLMNLIPQIQGRRNDFGELGIGDNEKSTLDQVAKSRKTLLEHRVRIVACGGAELDNGIYNLLRLFELSQQLRKARIDDLRGRPRTGSRNDVVLV